MKKQLLKVEFRYNKVDAEGNIQCKSRTIHIGVYNKIDIAVKWGNKLLDQLSTRFEVRGGDRFRVNGLFGYPDRLVSNCCYPTKGVTYYAKIEELDFDLVTNVLEDIFNN